MFEDRRARIDRRKFHNADAIPSSGCRRVRERRDFFRQYEPMPWWLQTNYAEEVQPPQPDREPRAHGEHPAPHHSPRPRLASRRH